MAEEYFLRGATAKDAEALAALARDTFFATFGHLYPPGDRDVFVAAAYAPEVWARAIADPSNGLQLAVRGDHLVGYAKTGVHALPYDPGVRRALELKNLYVVEAAKGQGVANALMDWTIAWADGADDLYLGVYSDNVRAQRFYARYGFAKIAEYYFPVGATRDREFILRKKLR